MDLREATPYLKAYVDRQYDDAISIEIKALEVSSGNFFRVVATFCDVEGEPDLGTNSVDLVLEVRSVAVGMAFSVIQHEKWDSAHANVVEIAKLMEKNVLDFELAGAPAEVIRATKELAQAMRNWSNLQGGAS